MNTAHGVSGAHDVPGKLGCSKGESTEADFHGIKALPASSSDAVGCSEGNGSVAGETSIDAAPCSSGAGANAAVTKESAAANKDTMDPPRRAPMKRERPRRSDESTSTRSSPLKAPRDMSIEEQRSTKEESDEDVKDRELKRLRQELEAEQCRGESQKRRIESLTQQLQAANNSLEKSKEYMSGRLVQLARWERDKAQDYLTCEASRLGKHRLEVDRISGAGHWFWEGGSEAERIKEMREHLKVEKASIEGIRRKVGKQEKLQRSKVLDNGDSDTGVEEGEEVLVMREICSQRATCLNREENELQKLERQLKIDRDLYRKQQIRLHAEVNSNFRHYPKLNHGRYQLLNLIGKGGFSEVFKALDLQTMTTVALKIHELDRNMTEPQRESFMRHALRERDIQKNMQHSRIVHLSDCFAISTMAFATVLELCEGDSLDAYIKKNGALQEKDARAIIIQILSGLRYMNTNGRKVIHYDLKPGNLFFHGGQVKISDFGLSKIVNESSGETIELTNQGAGTYWYLPPECFCSCSTPKISNKVDIWSTGVIFYELLFNRRPFGHEQSQEALMRSAVAGNAFEVVMPKEPKISNDAKEFMLRLLTVDREKRPDVLEACNDPYLKASKQLSKVQQSQIDESQIDTSCGFFP